MLSFHAGHPWLQKGAAPNLLAVKLAELAETVDAVRLTQCSQVKAFCGDNDADSFFSTGNDGLAWICWSEACAELASQAWGERNASLAKALARSQGPIAARVASRAGTSGEQYITGGGAVTAAADKLAQCLSILDEVTRRPFCDADVYLTPKAVGGSASLGWHVDDVDVLLLMLRGSKRFRVAGRTFGSRVAIDTKLEAGDALYIPALTFHSGGETARRGDAWGWGASLFQQPSGGSTMLSVALPWADATAQVDAQAAAAEWRQAIEDLHVELPASCNTWSFAASDEGRARIARLLTEDAAARFLWRSADSV
jgi:hypothetical protein